jgi:hypothetical protein
MFVDLNNNDFHLLSSSPCINAGSNEFVDSERDFEGKIRIFDGLGNGNFTVDLGAFEYGAPCNITNLKKTICKGEKILIGDSIFTTPGNYSVILTNINGCDSVINLELTVNQLDTSVTQVGNTLSSNVSEATYQWLKCSDEFSKILGQTSQSFSAIESGSYAVEVSQGGCVDTSECFEITVTGIIVNDLDPALIVFPNPTKGELTVDLGNVYTDVNFVIKDLTGQIVSKQKLGSAKRFSVIIDVTKGTYIVEIYANEGKNAVIKVVKE